MPFKYTLVVLLIIFEFSACTNKKATLFTRLDADDTGIDFTNTLQDTKGTNVFTFRNYYNGGGVAIGDVNNDGLNDIYLTSNQGDNQLLINKGNWKFENNAEKAGVKGSKYWSTGVTMVDINADGWLDIYVCNSGNAKGGETENELFINQKNGLFKEEANKYGLADRGLSTHAVFFDYDLDGDLDCYVLNNSFRPIGSFDFTQNLREKVDEIGGDRLYRNDGERFTETTQKAGIYSSDIGFGLGVSVADVNMDGYPDMYVSNDFFERDYLYINQHNGTFAEVIQQATGHLSLASMGSDIADINNDGQYDIFTTEMLPDDDKRLKSVTMFESYDVHKAKQRDGYHNQYMQNCLQLNNGDGTFSEIAFYAGVAATDWSWGALTFDMDNDGWKDIFVSNGIYKDLTNQDYIEFLANEENMQKIAEKRSFDYRNFTDKMTSTPLINYAFINNKNLTFTNKAEELGFNEASFSNGAAYGDLDNDGDNDLIINNVNMPLFIYKNNTQSASNHYLQIKLKGSRLNTFGVGATVKAYFNGDSLLYYHQPARGFQSCIPPNVITIGAGKNTMADSVRIIWPDKRFQSIKQLKTDSAYVVDIKNAKGKYTFPKNEQQNLLVDYTVRNFDTAIVHQENEYVDFDNDRLMPQLLSTENPYLAKGDVNGDGLMDFYFGGAKGYASVIYIQQPAGKFKPYIPDDFKKQTYLETAGAVFGDFDGDTDQDLIIGIGGNADEAGTRVYYPRFFENDGTGKLKWNPAKAIAAPVNASVLAANDFDKDNDLDLFVAGRSIPGTYGSSPPSYLFENDGNGNFKNVSALLFGKNTNQGMITGAQWADLDNNGFDDLVLAGNWMGIKIFKNTGGKFVKDDQLAGYKGWWSSLQIGDINQDGLLDIVAGNLGQNTKFKASTSQPITIYVKDFDNNGSKECITSVYKQDGKPYVFHLKQELVSQIPSLKKRFLKYESYAGKTFNKVFTDDMIKGAETHEINFLQSAVFINSAAAKFKCRPLPYQAQLSAINTILIDDVDRDNKKEIILAGNFYGFKPELGRLDANYGAMYKFENNRFSYIPPSNSGLKLNGQVRSSLIIPNKSGKNYYLFGKNDGKLTSYRPK